MISVLNEVAECALFVLACALALREPRHRPFAVWIGLIVAHDLLVPHVLVPLLASHPRPYPGVWRLVFHFSQVLYVLPMSVFVVATWQAFGVRRRRGYLLAWLAFAVTMALLVTGYAHSPGRGLYRLGPVVFHSATVYLIHAAVLTAMVWTGIAPRLGRLRKAASAPEAASMLSVLIFASWDVLRVGLPYALPASGSWVAVPSAQMSIALIAAGVHVVALSPRLQLAGATLLGAPALASGDTNAIDALLRRVVAAHAAEARRARAERDGRGGSTLAERFPRAAALEKRAGGTRVSDLAASEPVPTAVLEGVVVAAGSLHDVAAHELLARATELYASTSNITASGPRWPVLFAAEARQHPERAVVLAGVLAAVERLPPDDARRVLSLAESLYADVLAGSAVRAARLA